MSDLQPTLFGDDGATGKFVYLATHGEALLNAWRDIALAMSKTLPPEFSRNEWAYLIQFAGSSTLRPLLESAFGPMTASMDARRAHARVAFVPRRSCVVWLPNNVTLLGPLTVILLSLTGIPTTIKVGNRSDDLTSLWIEWLRQHCTDGAISDWLAALTVIKSDRNDPELLRASGDADVRIMFGSDDTASAIEALPHRIDAQSFYFRDRTSQAWMDINGFGDSDIDTLIKVFAIFGQLGCTSPQRVVLVGGNASQATELRDRMIDAWPTIEHDVPAYVASNVIATTQVARALGWDAQCSPRNCSTVASGEVTLPGIDGLRCLTIVGCNLEQACSLLPSNIQTIGVAGAEETVARWTNELIAHTVDRIVPLARMHHFGPVWDGMEFWRSLFRAVELP
jgi:hypothetical protein